MTTKEKNRRLSQTSSIDVTFPVQFLLHAMFGEKENYRNFLFAFEREMI